MTIESYDKLNELVEETGGLLAVQMETLRDLHEAGRLGVHVIAGIQDKLASHGLGHFPESLPSSQDAFVRIYKKGTSMAKIVEAVLFPSELGDAVLRETANIDTEEKLRQIRELVCE